MGPAAPPAHVHNGTCLLGGICSPRKTADAGLSQALDPMPCAAATCHERGGAQESLGRVVAVRDELLQHDEYTLRVLTHA